MNFKRLFVSAFSLALLASSAANAALQCGEFYLKADSTGLTRINGQEPQTQKITFLKADQDYDNVKIQWMLPSKEVGRWIGMDYIRRNGKPILNVEVIRKNMDEPRQFWTYDCVRLK
ncbi:hypothetical protein [Pantoea ananatis]|uniref:hypothetical protein n=1 Tax=Pantoea ananas TaxID=553 RepID=UPI0002417345|nr:hypothetical protein [Pantoea ananatis]UEG19776.1 hypothetical protein LLG94_10490 [Pantoea ananatis]CCF09303.1 hypothetical protein PANA5342_1910 [Pantoea ananatis LMG 5342]